MQDSCEDAAEGLCQRTIVDLKNMKVVAAQFDESQKDAEKNCEDTVFWGKLCDVNNVVDL